MALPELDGEASDDIRASLSAAFEEAETNDKPVDQVKPEPVEVIEETPEEPVNENETAEEKAGRLAGRKRDEHGRLLPGKADKVELKAPKESTAKVEDKQPSEDTTKASETVSKPSDAPPVGWTADAKAEWSKLSPVLKAAVLKRESEIENGGRQWSEEKRRYENVLSPIAQAAQRRGLNVEQGVQTLIAAQNYLDADPIEGIKRIAQTYGVNLATIAGSAPADGSPVNNPDISALVNQAVASALGPIQQRYETEEAQKFQSIQSIVDEFSSKNEHYSSVETEIGLLIPLIQKSNPALSKQQVLQEAYDRAVWANPHTRAAIQASQNADADAKRRVEQQAKASKARTASTSLTGSSVIGAGADQPQPSLRAELEAAFAQTG